MYVRAEFRDRDCAAAGIESLKREGVGKDGIEVFSARPVEFEPGVLDRASYMSLFAVLGALLFGVGSTAFMFWTQLDYPLITGGMPLNSGWATGVVTFEFTMMGAILGTVGAFFWESGLLRFGRRHAPSIRDDVLTLQVACEERDEGQIITVLRSAGATQVEYIEGPS